MTDKEWCERAGAVLGLRLSLATAPRGRGTARLSKYRVFILGETTSIADGTTEDEAWSATREHLEAKMDAAAELGAECRRFRTEEAARTCKRLRLDHNVLTAGGRALVRAGTPTRGVRTTGGAFTFEYWDAQGFQWVRATSGERPKLVAPEGA